VPRHKYPGSNNTAELCAIGEALLWCAQYLQSPPSTTAAMSMKRVVIRYDSEYAAKSVQGIFNGKKNVELIAQVRKHYASVLRAVEEVSFVHVKGHSNARWNDRADELAGQGAAGRVCAEGRYAAASSSSSSVHVSDRREGGVVRADSGVEQDVLAGSASSMTGQPPRISTSAARNISRTKRTILGDAKRSFHDLPDSRFSDSRLSLNNLPLYKPINRAHMETTAVDSSHSYASSSIAVTAFAASDCNILDIAASATSEGTLDCYGSEVIEVISLSSDSGSESEANEESDTKKRKIDFCDMSSP
jgi:ribonuclease HI